MKPILFSSEMINAIRYHGKTQTRRPLKTTSAFCPYGEIGDILWVRETWRVFDRNAECACYDYCHCPKDGTVLFRADDMDDSESKWRPSIHMPKSACRLFLQITSIKIERLLSITDNDAIMEGFKSREDFILCWWEMYGGKYGDNPLVWVIGISDLSNA